MKISIEQYNSNYKDSINQLLFVCYVDDNDSKMYFERGRQSPLNICTYIAKNNEEVIAAITAWKTTFHPYCTYFSILLHPLYRKAGIEKLLLKYVEAFNSNAIPLQTSIWETFYSLKDFYDKNSFSEIRRTYIASLNISSLVNVETQFIQKNCFPKTSIKSLRDILNNVDLKENLVPFVKKIYEITHEANPPGIHDLTKWEKLIFDEDTLLDGSYIAITDENKILGFALLHTGENPNVLEFGWRGAAESIDINLVILLTIYQTRYARKNGYKIIKGEIDTTDIYSLEMLKFFPFSPSPSLITYQKLK
ncbi:GNAT family N-acetyltransferase [Heyndrickxia shackletonii]|uniref:GNAT family N-acetyltransferase n=1 Tax=Heyndrickxia shackletonii TaxID=157838 RepID=UPI0006EC1644|nr:GNAT family N-acetyltransferase [Heyndrickxia shackletonii]NEY99121.1 GNAT family N-acetyltransferase [Heyndrickxia shackletonii]